MAVARRAAVAQTRSASARTVQAERASRHHWARTPGHSITATSASASPSGSRTARTAGTGPSPGSAGHAATALDHPQPGTPAAPAPLAHHRHASRRR